jgi:hypothetical protein
MHKTGGFVPIPHQSIVIMDKLSWEWIILSVLLQYPQVQEICSVQISQTDVPTKIVPQTLQDPLLYILLIIQRRLLVFLLVFLQN